MVSWLKHISIERGTGKKENGNKISEAFKLRESPEL